MGFNPCLKGNTVDLLFASIAGHKKKLKIKTIRVTSCVVESSLANGLSDTKFCRLRDLFCKKEEKGN